MKQNKKTIIILILAIFSATVAGIVGTFYYVTKYGLGIASVALVIRNVISCFAFVPSLSVVDILNWLNNMTERAIFNSTAIYSFMMILTHVYASIILIAPICTASALYVFILQVVRQIKWKIAPLFWKKTKEKVMIIGAGDAAARLILSEKKFAEDREIYYISAEAKTLDEEMNLMKQKIRCYQIDLVNCSDREFRTFLQNYKLETMNTIILCENSDAANFSLYIRLMKLGYTYVAKNSQICCKCEDTAMMKLITNYYDDNKTKCIPPKIFSIAKMRASSIMEKQALPVCPDANNMSFLIVGFGMAGQIMARNMMNLGVTSSNSKITIHVVDREMDMQKSMFLRNFSPEYFTISEQCCRIGSEHADGSLEIYFHKMDVRSMEFRMFLEQEEFQYASICIENVEHCLDCMQTMEDYIIRHNKTQMPIAVSLLSDPEITVYLNQDNSRYNNVFFIGASNYYNINQIVASRIEENAKKFHQIYQGISVLALKDYQETLAKGEERQDTPWEDMLFYKQESSRQLSSHQQVKEKILKNLKEKEPTFMLESYFGEDGAILQKKENTYVFDCSLEELVQKLNQDSQIRELGMIEHRRWCYCQAAAGWRYAPLKNEKRKETPYLVPWDRLCEEHPEVCVYDYMAYLI